MHARIHFTQPKYEKEGVPKCTFCHVRYKNLLKHLEVQHNHVPERKRQRKRRSEVTTNATSTATNQNKEISEDNQIKTKKSKNCLYEPLNIDLDQLKPVLSDNQLTPQPITPNSNRISEGNIPRAIQVMQGNKKPKNSKNSKNRRERHRHRNYSNQSSVRNSENLFIHNLKKYAPTFTKTSSSQGLQLDGLHVDSPFVSQEEYLKFLLHQKSKNQYHKIDDSQSSINSERFINDFSAPSSYSIFEETGPSEPVHQEQGLGSTFIPSEIQSDPHLSQLPISDNENDNEIIFQGDDIEINPYFNSFYFHRRRRIREKYSPGNKYSATRLSRRLFGFRNLALDVVREEVIRELKLNSMQ